MKYLFVLIFVLGCGAPKVDPGYELVDLDQAPDTAIADTTEYLLDATLPPRKPVPAEFRVEVMTTKGSFVLEIYREWSPKGAQRFHHLVDIGYFTDVLIFRAIAGFMFQFGIHREPTVNAVWKEATIEDEDIHPNASNVEGTFTFARSGAPNSRTNQFFVNLKDNARLDSQGFNPIGKVVEGMDVVRAINTEYGENREPMFQQNFQEKGNAYALELYPRLDVILSMTIVE